VARTDGEVIRQKVIETYEDLLEADLLDLNRCGHWENPLQALKSIESWFKYKAVLTELKIDDFELAPERDDWLEWYHVGSSHQAMGRAFWNWFLWKHPDAELNFSDAPDFWGYFEKGECKRGTIYGDIGKVSATCFAYVQKQMLAHDLWVSVLDSGNRHVLIEPLYSIAEAHANQIGTLLGLAPDGRDRITPPVERTKPPKTRSRRSSA